MTDTLLGAVKIVGLPEGCYFESFEELLKSLCKYLAIEIPDTITNVVIGNVQPADSQRDHLWFRKDNSGTFVGLYIYTGGQWLKVFPVPGQIFRLYGDSASIPTGFTLADTSNPNLTAAMAAALMAQWYTDGSGTYQIFDVTAD